MRARLVFIVLALAVVGGVAALNWPQFSRIESLSFGVFTTEASVGMFMLIVFGLTILVMVLSSAVQESRYMMESNRHAKALQTQRDLADKAEASRFTELRQYLDTHLRDGRQREAITATEFEKAMVQSQRELRTQLDTMTRSLDARLAALESRLDARVDRDRLGDAVRPSTAASSREAEMTAREAEMTTPEAEAARRERERL